MATVKAGRNKTIDTPLSEGQIYLDRCIAVTQRQVDLGGVLDKTVIGDMLDVCSLLPPKSIDLIIADPPYNLTKSFNGTTFTKKKEADYEEYTRQWLGRHNSYLFRIEPVGKPILHRLDSRFSHRYLVGPDISCSDSRTSFPSRKSGRRSVSPAARHLWTLCP